MKVVIISDIHDNLVNLKKCLKWCQKERIEKIVCCGDLTNNDTLGALSKNFSGEICLIKGNCEIYEEMDVKKYKNINYFGKIGYFKIDKKNVGACHEPFLIDKVMEKGECDIIFYGHTHKPWQETKNGVMRVNPGTLGGMFQLSTFAFWDNEKNVLELKVVEQL